MKTLLPYLTGFLLCVSTFMAADLYPRQPKLQAAHNNLMAARGQLLRSLQGQRQKHLNEATVALSQAQNNLENAAKNKGSSRIAAIREIEAAQAEIESKKSGDNSTQTAIQHVDKAIKEVGESARAGKR